MKTPRLGVDVGGTFTDVVVAAGDDVRVAKVPSTPDDQATGVLDGVDRLDLDPGSLGRFAHGTTVATNAVLERRGARTVLVTTAGFRDILQIGRQTRPSLYDLTDQRPPPLVPANNVVEADERIGAGGEEVVRLTDPEAVADAVAALEPEAVAISLLFCFLDDRHERAIEQALRRRLPDVPISRSSDVLPVFREFERTSTTVLNAYVAGPMGRYLASLDRRLAEAGLDCPVEVMRSGGGTFAASMAARYPVHTLLSGPAAGAWGAAAVGTAVGMDDIIGFDMGGTSTDVTLISGGRPTTTAEGVIDDLPFAVGTTDIHTVGAGGGSIAWADAGGALRVGPRSAGAVPGPACYGNGGTEPTVTDANVVLGHLDPDTRLGGDLPLRPNEAAAAVRRLGEQLDLDVEQTAAGILAVVQAHMVKALRVVSVERGHDPRDFTLVPFGGAGPLHQGALARELGCRRVLVPANPGVLSALGLLAAPVTVEEVQTHVTLLDETSQADLERLIDPMEQAASGLLREQGTEPAQLRRSVDVRYRGQAFELEVPATPLDPAGIVERFHDAHEERYGYAMRDQRVELVNLRVRAEGATPDVPLPTVGAGAGVDAATITTRRLTLDGGERDVPLIDRSRLGAGDRLRGPAIVVGLDSTCWVEPWQAGEIDEHGNLVLQEA